MEKIIIFFSFMKEAKPLLFQSSVKFKKKSIIEYNSNFKNMQIVVYITGIGKKSINTIANLNIRDSFLFIKAGTCAVIDDNLDLLKPVIPRFVDYFDKRIMIDLDEKNSMLLSKYQILNGLVTIDHFLNNYNESKELYERNYSVVDMETFYILEKYKGCIPILIGTDRGDVSFKIDFLNNITEASKLLKNILVEFFIKFK